MVGFKCNKCGNEDIDVKCLEIGARFELYNYCNTEYVDSYYDGFGHYIVTAKKEHLECRCKRCQYSWRQNTLENEGIEK